MIITIQELLKFHGFDTQAKVKLVRHKDARLNVYNLYRQNKDAFLEYQSAQSKPVFHDVDYIVSFIGEDNCRARFIGVYKIIAEKNIDEKLRKDPSDIFFYEMEEMSGFEELKERVIVKWSNTIAWNQWYKNEMEVVEITKGFKKKPFTSYLDFILPFDELKELVNDKSNDNEWRLMLSKIYGVYVIRDTKTNKLYIGSAYGKEGVWQRWEKYVATNGHGGNKSLKELVNADPQYGSNFAFSLLVIMSKNTSDDVVRGQEQLLKNKLGAELCNN